MKVCRKYDRRWAKGHIKDELQELIRIYHKYCLENNMIPTGTLYMHPITYYELGKELECACYNPTTGKLNSIYGYPVNIDRTMSPHLFEIREEDNMAREYCKNDVDTLDAYRYYIEGQRGAGKSNKVLTPLPTKYIVNDGVVILFWSDGDKTIVKRAKDDNFDPVKGFLWAYFQKHSGLSKTKANKYLRDLKLED